MKRIVILLYAFLLVVATNGFAQSKITKVGYVDIDEIINMLVRERQVYFSLRGQADRSTERIRALDAEIKELEAELEAEGLSERDINRIADDIAVRQEERDRYVREQKHEEMRSADIANVDRSVRKSIYTSIKTVARREGYTIVVERLLSGVLYVEPTVDLTDKVIVELRSIAQRKAEELAADDGEDG